MGHSGIQVLRNAMPMEGWVRVSNFQKKCYKKGVRFDIISVTGFGIGPIRVSATESRDMPKFIRTSQMLVHWYPADKSIF